MVLIEAIRPDCRSVTFILDVDNAGPTSVVGSFNDWDPHAHRFAIDDTTGRPVTRVEVAPGTVLRFRYLSDRLGWLDDEAAEQRWPNEHGTFDNIVFVPLHAEETQ